MPGRRAVVVGIATTIVSLAGRGWEEAAAMPETPMIDMIDPALRREALRHLRFAWAPFEAGAPSVDWLAPFGSSDPLADLARLDARAGLAALRRLYVAALEALPGFVAAAAPRLAPGRYTFDAADAAHLRHVAKLMAELGTPFDPGLADDGSFAYTSEHAAILPRLRWGGDRPGRDTGPRPDEVVPDHDADTGETIWPVVTVDPKRPYGDMTYVESDMAEALGIAVGKDARGYASLPQDVEARLARLHQSTPAALRVLVLHGAKH